MTVAQRRRSNLTAWKAELMVIKRCYNKSEAGQYFGIDLNSFETYIEPQLAGMGIAVGDCLVYEVDDLDRAWDAFKQKARATASASVAAAQPPAAAPQRKSKARTKEATPSPNSGSDAWNAAVKKVLEKGKARRK
jgi:hypothetical protein